eukprot:TRINITY_DN9344_c0_g2_i1.p1 TRINITY_DN9344_c0_g2~~TRINITY_DN9344_c0_g2_i1.p1  ORF type:complete len:561 (+),score=144.59 TRINITY_DN9344_c0_g2_i1:127-1809(+)
MQACTAFERHNVQEPKQTTVSAIRVVLPPEVAGQPISAKPDIDFSEWLKEKLTEERALMLSQFREMASKHLSEYRAVMLKELQGQLTELAPLRLLNDPGLSDQVLTQSTVEAANKTGNADNAAEDAPVRQAASSQDGKPLPPARRYSSKRIQALVDEHHMEDDGGISSINKMVRHGLFEVTSMSFIVLNTIVMALEIQYMGVGIGYSLEYPGFITKPGDAWPGAETSFKLMSVVFLTIFTIELIFRMIAMRWKAARSAWIWLDGFLIIVSFFDVLNRFNISSLVDMNPSMMRIARLARVLRMTKVLKSRNAFHSLFLLMKSIQASVSALFWSFLLLLFIMVVGGMLINQLLFTFFTDEQVDITRRHAVFKYFGTFSSMMISMFEVTLGNWAVPARLLMNNVDEIWGYFIIIYSCMFCFAVVNVIRAVFITETNRVAAGDDEVAMMNKERAAKNYVAKLHDLFEELDDSGDGKVTRGEFEQLLTDSVMKRFLSTLELEVADLDNLFRLLDDGDGSVMREEFVHGVATMKGTAKSIDVVTLLKVSRKMDEKIDRILRRCRLA